MFFYNVWCNTKVNSNPEGVGNNYFNNRYKALMQNAEKLFDKEINE